MRNRTVVNGATAIVLIVSLIGTPVLAHLTGVFAHFVDDINNPSASTRMLRQQLDSVGQRLAALQPEVDAARVAYDQEAEAAVRRIRFYDIYAGSALGALWAGAQDPIDVIASTELLQRRLGDDLDQAVTFEDFEVAVRGPPGGLGPLDEVDRGELRPPVRQPPDRGEDRPDHVAAPARGHQSRTPGRAGRGFSPRRS